MGLTDSALNGLVFGVCVAAGVLTVKSGFDSQNQARAERLRLKMAGEWNSLPEERKKVINEACDSVYTKALNKISAKADELAANRLFHKSKEPTS